MVTPDEGSPAISALLPSWLIVGARVEAQFRGRKRFYPGVVEEVRTDGTYAIMYDDGDYEAAVPLEYIRLSTKLQTPSG